MTDADALQVHRVGGAALAERAIALIGDELAAGTAPGDIAVLARVNSALLPVQVACAQAGIAHTAPLDPHVLQRTGIRTALAYLRLGLDTDRLRRDDVLDTLNRPARKVRSAVVPQLPRGSRWSIDALAAVADALDRTHRERFEGYLADLMDLEEAITDRSDTGTCLRIIRERIGLDEAMAALDASRRRPEGSSHGDDLDALEQLAALQPDPAGFEPWLVEQLGAPGSDDGVHLSTVHRVKGREWPVVVVFAATNGLFPHRLADDVEEERRVFHVALTRGGRRVAVIADRRRPSPFLEELIRPAEPVNPPTARAVAGQVAAPIATPSGTTDRPGAPLAVDQQVTLPGGVPAVVTATSRHEASVRLTLPGQPPTVTLPIGSRLLIDGEPHELTAAADAARREADAPVVDDELIAALRTWRREVARTGGVPAYLVLQDRHLQLLAGRRPTTLAELADCPGIGPTKLERYGDDLLDVIAEHRPG